MPDKEYYKNKALSFAAGRFEKGMLQGFRENNVEIEAYSIEPFSTRFPKGVFWAKSKEIHIEEVDWQTKTIGYVNVPFLKHICIGLALLRIILKNLKQPVAIVSYNADVPIIQMGLLATKLGLEYYPVLADLPFYEKQGDSLAQKLSSIGYKSQIRNLYKLKNAIVLNENVAKDFKIKNYLVMEGAVTNEELNRPDVKLNTNEKCVLYCGSLDVYHGSDKILELVKALPDVEFLICGKGKVWGEILERESHNYKNLKFFGAVSNEQLYELQKKANLLLIPHPTGLKQLKYQFPSKLMTCMASEIPVLTTPIPGITNEYKKYIIMSKTDSVDELVSEIDLYYKLDASERVEKGKSAREFIKEKNWKNQTCRIKKFLED